MDYIPFEDKECPPDWRVEALDPSTNQAYIAIFSGPQAKERAREYAKFKNVIPGQTPSPLGPSTLVVQVQNGQRMTLHLPGLQWRYDASRKTISGKSKDAIEPVIVSSLGESK